MVTGITMLKPINIGVSNDGYIQTPDNMTVSVQNIPFVRYRFKEFTKENIDFILENKQKFPCVHIAEVSLFNLEGSLPACDVIAAIKEADERIAIIAYIELDEEVVQRTSFSEEQIRLIETLSLSEYDIVQLKDVNTFAYGIVLSKLKQQVADILNIKPDQIGVCGGANCIGTGEACLTAIKARELMAMYAERDDLAVPSSNHEGTLNSIELGDSCTNHCGCVSYYIFSEDMPAPLQKETHKKRVRIDKANKQVSLELEIPENSKKKEKPATKRKQKVKGFQSIAW